MPKICAQPVFPSAPQLQTSNHSPSDPVYCSDAPSSRPPTALQTMRLWYFISSSTRIFHQNCKLSFHLFKGQIVLITRKIEYGYSHMSPPMHSYYIFWRWTYFVLWLFFAWFPADFLQTYGFTYNYFHRQRLSSIHFCLNMHVELYHHSFHFQSTTVLLRDLLAGTACVGVMEVLMDVPWTVLDHFSPWSSFWS